MVAVAVVVALAVRVVVSVGVGMNNPQHTGLTAEHVELLRSLPRRVTRAESAAYAPVSMFTSATLHELHISDDSTLDEYDWRLTRNGKTLLATLDAFTAAAVKEGRERVCRMFSKMADEFIAEGDGECGYEIRAAILQVAPEALAATPQDQSGSAGRER